MEGLENATITPSVTPAPAAPLTAAPQSAPAAPAAAPAAPAAAPAPINSSESSSSDNSLMGIIKSLNWIEVTFGIIGAAALYYTIYYYKYNMTNGDKTRNEMQNRIDALEIKLAELKTEEESKKTIDAIF
jgi:hypothetical protein